MILLLTDDQRADTIGALGNPVIKTPVLDSLARRGTAFSNCYCFGGNSPAVCMPSRNMLMSGRSYFRWKGPMASGDDPNLPVAMKQAGYETYHHGKRGNSAQLIQAKFDICRYQDDETDRRSGEPGQYIIDDAIAFLRQRKGDKPFLMYLAPSSPHDPRIAAQKYHDLYKRDDIPLPPNYLPQHPFNNGEMVIRDELLAPWPRTPDEIRRQLHDYYADISAIDGHFGRLLSVLRELRLDDKTIIIFASDNGLAIGSHGLMGKQNLYEHSAKVPLIIAGPGIPAGRSDALVYLLDLFPTICELCGVPVPGSLDGRSLAPVLQGRSKSVRSTLFMSYRELQRGIRDERWKLIHYMTTGLPQLFDLQNDPHERHDLAAEPGQAERIKRMTIELRRWQKDLGDVTPLIPHAPVDPKFTPPKGAELDALLKRWRMKPNS